MRNWWTTGCKKKENKIKINLGHLSAVCCDVGREQQQQWKHKIPFCLFLEKLKTAAVSYEEQLTHNPPEIGSIKIEVKLKFVTLNIFNEPVSQPTNLPFSLWHSNAPCHFFTACLWPMQKVKSLISYINVNRSLNWVVMIFLWNLKTLWNHLRVYVRWYIFYWRIKIN